MLGEGVKLPADHWADPGGRSLEALDEYVGAPVRELIVLEDVAHLRRITFGRRVPPRRPVRARKTTALAVMVTKVLPLALFIPGVLLH